MNLTSFFVLPIICAIMSALEICIVGFVGSFVFGFFYGSIAFVQFIIFDILLFRVMNINRKNFINLDEVAEAAVKFFTNRDVVKFIWIFLTIYNFFAMKYDLPYSNFIIQFFLEN